jgi:DNA modification methylase
MPVSNRPDPRAKGEGVKPYYEEPGITIYHGDCRELWSSLLDSSIDLLLTDPPYGIGADRNLRANKQHGKAAAPSKDYGIGTWDREPCDTATLKRFTDKIPQSIIWGGNYFGMPASKCWLVWDKDNGDNGYADCELAWTNLDMAVRKFKHRWMGMLQQNMKEKEERYHPTQKPTEVMRWCLGLVPDAQTILDPFMGSGTTLRAAKDLGRKAIGIEIEEKYCEIAVKRLAQEVLF